ncbi:hypothetical protein EBT31_12345 [bacterium]|nr:hypothetical protein [bacterium]
MLYSKPDAPDYMDVKGIQLVRRDNCPLVRTASSEILHVIMGFPVQSGERVPYVFVDLGAETADQLQAARAEDPDYVREHNVPVDVLYYVDSQLSTPIEMLLDVLRPGTFGELMDGEDIKPLLDALRRKSKDDLVIAKRVKTNTKNNQREITSFFFRS